MNLDSIFCPAHGWLSHAVIHEAAHAVFAVNLGFPFVDVSVTPGADVWDALVASVDAPDDAESPPQALAGGLRLVEDDPTAWVPARADDALDLLLAGGVAEFGFFGHTLTGSMTGDLQMWARGMGIDSPSQVDLHASTLRAQVRLRGLESAVRAVAGKLTDQLNVHSGDYDHFDSPIVMNSDEVAEIMAGVAN